MNATTTCRSCGAPIRWELTAKGKPRPISLATGLPHFADCPDARDWSRRKDTPPGPRATFVHGSGWIRRR
jgi:hypothetical protein